MLAFFHWYFSIGPWNRDFDTRIIEFWGNNINTSSSHKYTHVPTTIVWKKLSKRKLPIKYIKHGGLGGDVGKRTKEQGNLGTTSLALILTKWNSIIYRINVHLSRKGGALIGRQSMGKDNGYFASKFSSCIFFTSNRHV